MQGDTFNKRLFMVCNKYETDVEFDRVYLIN